MARKKIPRNIKSSIMYESQYACVVCQQRGSHIHHIDKDHSNNLQENLVLLCNTHHDEAHTNHQLSQNLSQDALRDSKQKWLSEVRKKRDLSSTLSGQLSIAKDSFTSLGVTWSYINHRRVAQLAKPGLLCLKDKKYFDYCKKRNIIDKMGILIKPNNVQPSDSYARNSVYDWYEYGDDQRIHRLYTAFVDQISINCRPIHLETKYLSKSRILNLIIPGNFIFLDRPFYFKSIEETKENQHRHVHTAYRNIKISFYIDTMNMFGTTSMTESFCGHKHCAALLQLKSYSEIDESKLLLECTPIALGVGFKTAI